MAGSFPEREFGQLKSQSRLVKIAEAKRTDYWAGSTWVYRATLTNGAAAGDMTTSIQPGEDNEFEVLYGSIDNLDVSTRLGDVFIQDETPAIITRLVAANLTPTTNVHFPNEGSAAASGYSTATRYIVSGEMFLFMRLNDIAGTQDGVMAVALRIRGDAPIVTNVVTSGGTVVVSREKFY